ncbi:MFS transporter [Deinococcus sp. Marseille-Q6407]|uniref:MFS transporter n=1 Tax=Deinococcus sp. Marseille-Q6407 TaxID=2969223 RepID=UPI0021BECED2|nr:MFS transporter [Deinococcus sp. Marseille-Q6407]
MPRPSLTRPWRDWSANERLGVLNGWLVLLGEGFMNVAIVMAGFAAKLGAPNVVIGLLPAIGQGGWMLPQLYIAARARPLTHKLPLYRSAATVRTVTYLLMAACAAFLTDWPALCLTVFLLAMLVNALASGVSGLPWLEIVSKTVPAPRRAWFFGTRNLYGGLLAFFSGLGVRWILGSGLAFPYNYALIFLLGTVALTAGYGVFGRVEEPPDQPLPPGNFRSELRAIPHSLQDSALKAFQNVRLLLAFGAVSEPFYAVYALRDLDFPAASLGTFVMATTAAAPLSNVGWQRVAERKGSRRILRYAAAFAALAPATALLAGHFGWPPLAYGLVFVLSSVAVQGFNLGNNNHLLNISPPESRGRYIGTLNTLVGVALFAPVLGGLAADRWGYLPLFVSSVLLYSLAWWACGQLRRDA